MAGLTGRLEQVAVISIADLIDELIEDTPDFIEGYISGSKWVADKYYDGDLSKLSPMSEAANKAVKAFGDGKGRPYIDPVKNDPISI